MLLVMASTLPWFVNGGSSNDEVVKLDKHTLNQYDSLICEYSLSEFINKNSSSEYNIELDKTSSIGCFSKINGTAQKDGKITIYVGSNINLDLLIQSFFWLVLLSLIPKTKKNKLRYKKTSIFTTVILIFFHLSSEGSFYALNSKIFSTDLIGNYLLYSYLLSFGLILFFLVSVIEERFFNLVNYLPFIFIFIGAYNSSNLNFFFITFILLGVNQTLINKKFRFGMIVILLFITLWTSQIIENLLFFDVDKLKGFSSSSYTTESIFFWSLGYFFFYSGLVFLYRSTSKDVDLSRLTNNFLYSGFLITIFSAFSATGPLQNLYTYYYFGLNKRASDTFESVSGNAWRGMSPSAEGVGEFFAFTILLAITLSIKNKHFKLSYIHYLLIISNLYGLYRSNNVAASLSMVILVFCILVVYKVKTTTRNKVLISLIFFVIPISYISFFNTTSLDELNRKVIKEGLEISFINNLETNEIGFSAVDQNRFLELLQSQKDLEGVSTSLTYLIEKYHYSERNNIPNITSLISTIAYPINRSEKWGIFIGKYDPSIISFTFGTGLNNLANYYLLHPTKMNSGLVLPHSGLLSYLVYIGAIGILYFIFYITIKLYKNRENYLYLAYLMFFLVNILKSDSLLYINNFILFTFILHSDQLDFKLSKNKEPEAIF